MTLHPTSPPPGSEPSTSSVVRPSGRQPRDLPLFLWLLVGFLGVDGILQLFALTSGFAGETGDVLERYFVHIITATISLLLILMILVRSLAARVWGSVYLGLQIVYFVAKYAYLEPEAWLTGDSGERLQLTARLAFFVAALIFLNTGPSVRALRLR